MNGKEVWVGIIIALGLLVSFVGIVIGGMYSDIKSQQMKEQLIQDGYLTVGENGTLVPTQKAVDAMSEQERQKYDLSVRRAQSEDELHTVGGVGEDNG